MPEPIVSLRYSNAVVLNLALLDPSFEERVATARQLLLSLSDGSGRISSAGVFETGVVSVHCPYMGTVWQIDFQLVWPQPLMGGLTGELKLVNWFAAGGDAPGRGLRVRGKASTQLRERIDALCREGQPLAGRVRLVNPE